MVIAVDAFKLAYSALPKAGCSSVKEALARLDPTVEMPDGAPDGYFCHSTFPTRRFRPHRWEAYAGYHRFCVIRDPVKRLLSVYTNRVLQFGDVKNSRRLRKKGHRWPNLPRDPDADTFFRNLERYKRKSSSIKHHAMGAWLFLGRDLGAYDRVYKTEEMDRLAADLSARTGRAVVLPRRNRSEARLALADLSGAAIDAIRPFLDQEYAYLAGYYDNPLGPRIHDACVTPVRRVS